MKDAYSERTKETILRSICDDAYTDEIILATIDLLECGYEDPKLTDIACERIGISPDYPVKDRFFAAVRDLGLAQYDKTSALTFLAKIAVKRSILLGSAPFIAVDSLWQDSLALDFVECPTIGLLMCELDDAAEWMSAAQKAEVELEILRFCGIAE